MKNRLRIHHATPEDAAPWLQETDDPDRRRFEIDPLGLVRLLFRRRRWIVGVVVTVGVLAALIMLLTPNRYTSRATILPSGKSEGFSALKAMTGLSAVLGSDDGSSSTFFPVILRSHLVRDSILARTFRFDDDGETVQLTMAEYLGIDDPDRLRQALADITAINSETRTGEITVAVETEYPELSQAVVQEYLRQLENYNLYSRCSEARERVRYLTRELDERRNSLAASEDALSAFQSRNRNWASTTDPGILMQLGRLKREVEIKSQTLAYLLQEFEAARLDAQKDVPVVRVLDQASLPTVKSGPHRTITVLLSAMISFLLVVVGIFVFDLAGQLLNSGNPEGRGEVRRQIAEAFPKTHRWYGSVKGRLKREPISVDSAG